MSVKTILVAHRSLAVRDRFAAALAEAASKSESSAATVWQGFLHRFPHDEAALRRLAECHLQARQPAMALRALQSIDEKRMTDHDRRQAAVLKQL